MANANDAVYSFTVNGVEIKTPHEKLTAGDILRLAIGNGAISGKAEDYILESHEPERQFKADDVVDLTEFNDFITEKTGPTPVASRAS